MSGKDERPVLPLLDTCSFCLEKEEEELEPADSYYTIYNRYKEVIGYFNTQFGMDEGVFLFSLDIHSKYENYPRKKFEEDIHFIVCGLCNTFVTGIGYPDLPEWIRRVRQSYELNDYQYDESMAYHINM